MILCLDYGERYIGVASTDADEKIALRHSTIDQSRRDAFAALKEIVAHEKIKVILVGVPVSLGGTETQQTRVSLAFMEKLHHQLDDTVSIESIDETLTSVEAERSIRAEGGKREEAHAEAARLMLVDYLRARP